jgi:hypothetical protein
MKQHQSGQFGGILGKLLGLLVLAMLVGGGWWWFFGRFALPESEPSKLSKPTAVLDYAGRRDLGLDPFDALVRPDPKTAREGSPERMPAYLRWFKEYGATVAACATWRAHNAIAVGGLGGEKVAELGREAHLTYLHHAQLAEYYRAKWLEAGGE